MLFALAHEAAAWFIILRDAHDILVLESFSFPVLRPPVCAEAADVLV